MTRHRCPKCDETPVRSNTRYGPRLDCCGLWAWGDHPLADAATHAARRAAHDAFDPIWREGLLSRTAAYRELAKQMQLSASDCHMKLMTASQAQRVVCVAAKMRARLTQPTRVKS